MAVTVFRRAAARAPVPVFVAVGRGASQGVERLAAHDDVRVVASPRHATVLLVAGAVPERTGNALRRVHDQMPHPRATVWWTAAADESIHDLLPEARVVLEADEVRPTVVGAHRDLFSDLHASDSAVLPDEPPAPWRGEGEHGQGGEGMMGGHPFGRPMAMVGEDRDGLMLDRVEARIGPFFRGLPPGVEVRVVLQGDVVQDADVGAEISAADRIIGVPVDDGGDVFIKALTDSVPLAELEMTRARHHLFWLAGFLDLHGLTALARRTRRLAVGCRPGDGEKARRLGTFLRRAGSLRGATRGVGGVTTAHVVGPNGRAAGRAEDARSLDPAYRSLDFAPVVHEVGDAEARWQQRVDEAAQALDLAALAGRSGDLLAGGEGSVESPVGTITPTTGSPTTVLLGGVGRVLEGMDWHEAVTTIASLDLDVDFDVPAPAGALP